MISLCGLGHSYHTCWRWGTLSFLCFSFDRPRLGSFDLSCLCLCLDDLSDELEEDEDDSNAEKSESS